MQSVFPMMHLLEDSRGGALSCSSSLRGLISSRTVDVGLFHPCIVIILLQNLNAIGMKVENSTKRCTFHDKFHLVSYNAIHDIMPS
jgi:hypothetical protein